ncbi:MAG: ABC transporter permease, partial [Bryobacteraceae bacterium]
MTVSWTSDASLAAPITAGPSRQGLGANTGRSAAAWPYAIARGLIGVSGLVVLLIFWWIGTDVLAAP